jgi:methionyl-tRNA formyltransferase
MLVETIDKIEQGSACYIEQDHSKATLAPKLKKTDGYITFDVPAQKVRDLIRGLWPWPGAAAMYVSKTTGKSRRVIFAMAELLTEDKIDEDLSAGTLDKNLNIICSPGAIRITEIKPAGGHKMSFNAFVNGHRVGPYDKFVKIER